MNKPTTYKDLIIDLSDAGFICTEQNEFEICTSEFLNDEQYYKQGINTIKKDYKIEILDGEDFTELLENDMIINVDSTLYSINHGLMKK